MGFSAKKLTTTLLQSVVGFDVAAHKARHASGGSDAIEADDLVAGADKRSSSHKSRHASTGADAIAAGDLVAGADPRSSSHKARHASGGDDAIAAGDLVAGADPRSTTHASRHATAAADALALADLSIVEALADGAYLGIVKTLTAGEALSKYHVCYRDVTTTKVKKAQANAAGTVPALYMALADIAQNASGLFLAVGYVANSGWAWTIGGEILVSDTAAGGLTQTIPSDSGDQVQRVGMAESATVIFFKPDMTVVEVA